MTRLTICICAHNAERRIGGLMDSLVAQSDVEVDEWEVVVVDNRSSDGTLETASKYGPGLKCGLYLLRDESRGKFRAFRSALAKANGEFVAIVDDDMLLDSRWVRECLDFVEKHQRAGVVGGKILVQFEDSHVKVPELWEKIKWMLAIRDDWGDEEVCLHSGDEKRNSIAGAGAVFRTEALRRMYAEKGLNLVCDAGKGSRKPRSRGGDIEMARRVVRQGWEQWYCPAMVARHCIPNWRLDKDYLTRLKFEIASGCIANEDVEPNGKKTLSAMTAVKRIYWSLRVLARNPKVWLASDLESRLRRSGMLGRLHGSLIHLPKVFRK